MIIDNIGTCMIKRENLFKVPRVEPYPDFDKSHEIPVMLYNKNVIYHNCVTSNTYRKTSNVSRTLVSNKIVDNSNVVGASPVGAAPTTSLFST